MKQQDKQSASIRTLLETTEAWNGTKYTGYPQGQPKITLLHVVVPPNTRLDAHSHPVPSAGYMLRGALYLRPLDGSKEMVLLPGNGCPEMQGVAHFGYTKEEGAEFVVFFAGAEGVPLTAPLQAQESKE